jgi:hypothetical protein
MVPTQDSSAPLSPSQSEPVAQSQPVDGVADALLGDGHRPVQVSSVSTALACPSAAGTVSTLSPDRTSAVAQKCRRS